jgi:ribosome biogenesis GTPase
MEIISLSALGWNSFFESQLQAETLIHNNLGRISIENKTNYQVISTHGEFIGEVTGRLMYAAESEAQLPKVGDWVLFQIMDDQRAIIHQVMERRTVISRNAPGKKISEQVIVTNLDVLFIVQGLDDNYNVSRLERYLSALQRGILPVVVLNKADCCNDVTAKIQEVQSRLPGIAVISSSSVNGDIQALQNYITEGKTFAFVGSSGVGKSTLINSLLNKEFLKTSAVREKDSKGRHTTTRREMHLLPSGGILIDTPGMREFQPWSDDKDLSVAFHDIEALASACRYSDCQHLHEDHCAVKEAVASGEIAVVHYENYLKLKREMEYHQSLADPAKALERKKITKKLTKAGNKIIRNKNK